MNSIVYYNFVCSDDDVEERRETIPDRKGPAMPTKAELALAAKLSMQNSSIFNDNSDDEGTLA